MRRETTLVLAAVFAVPAWTTAEPVTVLYDDQVIEVARTLADPDDLWVVPADLPRVNGFELTEGACLEELCVELRRDTGRPEPFPALGDRTRPPAELGPHRGAGRTKTA